MSNWLNLYYQLPYSLQVIAASARGHYLRAWRYGKETEKLVEEALDREYWSPSKWKSWQEERLAYVLHQAATHVPYYREDWTARRRNGDHSSWEVVENWPILKKESIRKNPKAFLSDKYSSKSLFREQTSGTTGTPLTLWFSRDTLVQWYALVESRWRRWYNLSNKVNWANIGAQRIVPFDRSEPPFWVWNAGLRQLYLSSLHFKPAYLHHYLRALQEYSIRYIYGYSSCLYWLAQYIIETGQHISQLNSIITCAEPVFDYQKKVMREAFDCEIRETYGQAEKICAASECEYGTLHTWPEVGYFEIINEEGDQIRSKEPGRLISTSLFDGAMPLIRYDTSDMASVSGIQMDCQCGRGLPILSKIEGRYNDAIVTKEGRLVGQVDAIFRGDLRILEGQIIQETIDRFTIKVVPIDGWSDEDDRLLINHLKARVGEVEAEVRVVTEIERTWAGKFRAVISKVNNLSL